MNRISALRRRRLEAQAQLLKAEASPKRKGRRAARRRFILATAEILRADLNNRIAAPAAARPGSPGPDGRPLQPDGSLTAMFTDILIRVVDLETTGFTPPAAEPIEIGWINLRATQRDLAGEPTGWAINLPNSALVRHAGPIPPETSAIHHLTAEDFGPDANPLEWSAVTSWVCRPARPGVDYFAAHNAGFERQFLTDQETRDRPWICTWKCALRLWPEAPAHSNQALRYWRSLKLDRAMANQTHRAGPDAYVTAHLLRDMLEQPGVTLAQLVAWSAEPALLARCQIGRWRGTPWREIDDMSFLRWLLDRDFSEEVHFTARYHLDRLSSAAEAEPVTEGA